MGKSWSNNFEKTFNANTQASPVTLYYASTSLKYCTERDFFLKVFCLIMQLCNKSSNDMWLDAVCTYGNGSIVYRVPERLCCRMIWVPHSFPRMISCPWGSDLDPDPDHFETYLCLNFHVLFASQLHLKGIHLFALFISYGSSSSHQLVFLIILLTSWPNDLLFSSLEPQVLRVRARCCQTRGPAGDQAKFSQCKGQSNLFLLFFQNFYNCASEVSPNFFFLLTLSRPGKLGRNISFRLSKFVNEKTDKKLRFFREIWKNFLIFCLG
jgi:hypothetical protein